MKWYEYLLSPFWIIPEIISEIYWHFKRKKNRDTSNSLAEDYIEDRYFI